MASKKKAGRPKIEIDWKVFDQLCTIQCTLDEISAWFNCSPDTIENRCVQDKKLKFSEYFKKKSAGGRISLRRKQYQVAEGGNVAMLIWLGKQALGQKDKVETGAEATKATPVKIEIVVEDGRVSKAAS